MTVQTPRAARGGGGYIYINTLVESVTATLIGAMFSRARMRAYDDDSVIDFSNAALYLSAIQTVGATMATATTAILACAILPIEYVSAVRTLTLSSIVAALCMINPVRLGRVHGLALIFNALRPCLVVYLGCLVLENLLHTCTREEADAPSWRKVVFQAAILGMIVSGFMRARAPLLQTDMPFLITAASGLIIAVLPPPAVSMQGPLCQPASVFQSAERLLRAFVFSSLYCFFVFLSAPSGTTGATVICFFRASAASVWTLGCPTILLFLALPQAALAVYARLNDEEERERALASVYDSLPNRSPPAADTEYADNASIASTIEHTPPPTAPKSPSTLTNLSFGPLFFREVTAKTDSSKEKMAAVAAKMAEDDERP